MCVRDRRNAYTACDFPYGVVRVQEKVPAIDNVLRRVFLKAIIMMTPTGVIRASYSTTQV